MIEHSCFKLIADELSEKNTCLDMCSLVNMKTGKIREALKISTRRLDDSKKRTKVITVCAAFCPFCGERLAATEKGEPT